MFNPYNLFYLAIYIYRERNIKPFSIYICLRDIDEYFAKKRMSLEAVDALEKLTKGKDFKVIRGRKVLPYRFVPRVLAMRISSLLW